MVGRKREHVLIGQLVEPRSQLGDEGGHRKTGELGGVWAKVITARPPEAQGGAGAAAFPVAERDGDLDQSFVVATERGNLDDPEVFEDFVCFVEIPFVEEAHIGEEFIGMGNGLVEEGLG